MKVIYGVALSVTLLACACVCATQEAPIPFKQIEQNLEFFASPAASGGELDSGLNVGATSGVSSSAALFNTSSSTDAAIQALTAAHKRHLGRAYYLLNGLHLGMAALDLAFTQHCIAEHRCREGNPLMPPSLGGRVGLTAGLVGFGFFESGRQKLKGAGSWWAVPIVGIGAHGAGIATGLAHW